MIASEFRISEKGQVEALRGIAQGYKSSRDLTLGSQNLDNKGVYRKVVPKEDSLLATRKQ